MNKKTVFLIFVAVISLMLCDKASALSKVGSYGSTWQRHSGVTVVSFKNNTNEETNQNETSGVFNIDSKTWLYKYSNYTDLFLKSKDNLKLHNYIIKNKNKSNKWIIAVHGYTSNGKYMASYAQKFYEMGYNIIIPDLRGHGKSDGDYIGMGWHDRLDLLDWTDYVINKNKDCRIIWYGVSMGAATVMMATGENVPSNVKVAIEDCGYTSVWDEFKIQLKSLFGLPSFPVLNAASTISNIKAGYTLKQGSSIEQIKKSKIPILFIHGSEDKFVPFNMLDELYNAATCQKDKLVVEGAAHAESDSVNPELYWNKIDEFIENYVNN